MNVIYKFKPLNRDDKTYTAAEVYDEYVKKGLISEGDVSIFYSDDNLTKTVGMAYGTKTKIDFLMPFMQ
jgi:hypothetical protein